MSDENRVLALLAGLIVLAGPRRTRPLAGVAYGLFLSRVQGAALRRVTGGIAGTIESLFDQRTSVGERLDLLADRVADLELEAAGTREDSREAWHRIRGRLIERT